MEETSCCGAVELVLRAEGGREREKTLRLGGAGVVSSGIAKRG